MFSEYCVACPCKAQCFEECRCIVKEERNDDLRERCKGLMGCAELSDLNPDEQDFIIMPEFEPDDLFASNPI